MSDNFHFDLTGVSMERAMGVAFSQHPKGAVGWREMPVGDRAEEAVGGANKSKLRLVLFWIMDADVVPFPAQMDAESCTPFVKAWLGAADYGTQPDQDGDNEKGFRAYNEVWGHVARRYQAFVAIEPVWLMYGK